LIFRTNFTPQSVLLSPYTSAPLKGPVVLFKKLKTLKKYIIDLNTARREGVSLFSFLAVDRKFL
jgi:hypothetical protein